MFSNMIIPLIHTQQFGRNADKDTAPTLQNSRLGRLAEGNMLPKKPSHDEKTAHKTAPKQVVEGSQHLTPFQVGVMGISTTAICRSLHIDV